MYLYIRTFSLDATVVGFHEADRCSTRGGSFYYFKENMPFSSENLESQLICHKNSFISTKIVAFTEHGTYHSHHNSMINGKLIMNALTQYLLNSTLMINSIDLVMSSVWKQTNNSIVTKIIRLSSNIKGIKYANLTALKKNSWKS